MSFGKYKEVLTRAETALENKNKWWYSLLDFGLDNLSIGKALLHKALQNRSTDFSKALEYLNRAVDGLREAEQQFLPLGLLARAALYRHMNNPDLSWADLDEAKEIAEYGSMKLHFTDYYLKGCRNIRNQLLSIGDQGSRKLFIIENGEKVKLTKQEMEKTFQRFLAEAERFIHETGYHRRDNELAELKEWADRYDL